MLEKIRWFGHSAFRVDASKTIYFDPYHLPANPKKADIILISHEHFDHLSSEDIRAISTENTHIVCGNYSAAKVNSDKIAFEEIKVLSAGESINIAGFDIKGILAYNTNKLFHQPISGGLGFIVTVEEAKIYHAGDTDLIPEMKDICCGIALLPVGGTYTMDPAEAARAALIIKPKIAIPMHYGDGVGSERQAEEFKRLLEGKIRVEILKKES